MAIPGPVTSRQDKPHPHAVFPTLDGAFLLVCDLGADRIRIFSINSSDKNGTLEQCNDVATSPGDGPRHAEFSAAGDALYVVNELSNTLTKYAVVFPVGEEGKTEKTCMSLVPIQTLSTLAAGKKCEGSIGMCKASEVRVRDEFIYVANRNDEAFGTGRDSISVYRDLGTAGNASMALVQSADSGVWFPRTFVINRVGNLVAVGGQTSSTVVILERNIATGMLGGIVAEALVGVPGTENNEDGLSAIIWDE